MVTIQAQGFVPEDCKCVVIFPFLENGQKFLKMFETTIKDVCWIFIKIGQEKKFVDNSEISPDSETFTVTIKERFKQHIAVKKHFYAVQKADIKYPEILRNMLVINKCLNKQDIF